MHKPLGFNTREGAPAERRSQETCHGQHQYSKPLSRNKAGCQGQPRAVGFGAREMLKNIKTKRRTIAHGDQQFQHHQARRADRTLLIGQDHERHIEGVQLAGRAHRLGVALEDIGAPGHPQRHHHRGDTEPGGGGADEGGLLCCGQELYALPPAAHRGPRDAGEAALPLRLLRRGQRGHGQQV